MPVSWFNSWPARAGLVAFALLLTGFIPPVASALNAFGVDLVARKDYWPAGVIFRYLTLVGHASGTNNYGVLRYNGLGMSWNHAEGTRMFAAAMRKGSDVAIFNFADSPGGESGEDAARRGNELLRTLVAKGNVHATAALGHHEFNASSKKSTEVDEALRDQALEHLRTSAETGDLDYKLMLAEALLWASMNNKDSVFIDEAVRSIDDVYRRDEPLAALFIAEQYDSLERLGHAEDLPIGQYGRWGWYKFAADSGSLVAACRMGIWLTDQVEHQRPEASGVRMSEDVVPYLRRCAENAPATSVLPMTLGGPALYVEKPVAFTLRYLGLGLPKGAYRKLARIYGHGIGGVPVDPALSRQYQRLSDKL